MLSVLIGSFLIMMLGLFDDMTKCKTPMPNKYKVIVQLIVAAVVVLTILLLNLLSLKGILRK